MHTRTWIQGHAHMPRFFWVLKFHLSHCPVGSVSKFQQFLLVSIHYLIFFNIIHQTVEVSMIYACPLELWEKYDSVDFWYMNVDTNGWIIWVFLELLDALSANLFFAFFAMLLELWPSLAMLPFSFTIVIFFFLFSELDLHGCTYCCSLTSVWLFFTRHTPTMATLFGLI